MKGLLLASFVALLPLSSAIGQVAHAAAPESPPVSAEAAAWVQKHLEGWPKISIAVASDPITKYGLPKERNDRELAWYDNGPWKRTVLHRDEMKHNFPLPRQDVLEQTVNYRVPLEIVAFLLKYDGSHVVDRTRGELTVRGGGGRAGARARN